MKRWRAAHTGKLVVVPTRAPRHESGAVAAQPIWTGDPSSPWTDALLVEDGRIISVGGDAHDGGAAEVIDLPGALVMPGLHDAHIHTEWVARDLAEVDLREARRSTRRSG